MYDWDHKCNLFKCSKTDLSMQAQLNSKIRLKVSVKYNSIGLIFDISNVCQSCLQKSFSDTF